MKRTTGWALGLTMIAALVALISNFTPSGRSQTDRQGGEQPPAAASDTGYRSPGDRHKVSASDPQVVQNLTSQGGRVISDYGSFVLLEVSDAVANGLANTASAQVVDENNLVLLNAGAIDTTTPVAQSMRGASSGAGGKQMRLIQFAGPIRPEWYQALAATGVRIVTYIPNNAYLIYGTPETLQGLHKLASNSAITQWDGDYSAAYRLDPAITGTRNGKGAATQARNKVSGESNLSAKGNEQFTIQMVDDPTENVTTLALIGQYKLEPIIKQDTMLGYLNVRVALPKEAVLNEIAARGDVVSIQQWITPKKRDERQDIIMTGAVTGSPAIPTPSNYLTYLTGKGFDVTTTAGFAVNLSDSGIDNATTTPNHFGLYRIGDSSVPANSRIIYNRLQGTPNGGSTLQGCDGHGNENAHIICGYVPTGTVAGVNFGVAPHADASGFRWGLGLAPFVKVGSSVIFDPDTFTSPTYQNLESQAYRDGARISSNSWGGSSSSYTVDSQQYDGLVRDAQPDTGCSLPNCISTVGNQEYVILFAAGNGGPGAGTVGEPSTGKNVISVGAAENVNPFGGADNCGTGDSGADNANDIIDFSSRGPTADGRKKPDIVAPGTHVSAGVAQATLVSPAGSGTGAQLACFDGSGVCGGPGGSDFFPAGQQWYTASSGTSHSTPATAGVAALIRQHFINQAATPPTPAMTKALLLNSARYMNGAFANDALPSNNQGMGEVNLNSYFDIFSTAHAFHDQVAGETFTASGQQRVITGTISNVAKPFRVTLAWTDTPGPTSGNAFVNNLDLEVTVGGNTYKGNVFSGAFSATGGTADTRNNVESVFVPAGVSGTFVIKVKAINIAGDGVPNNAQPLDQDFALVEYNVTEGALPVISAGATAITAESCAPANGAIDPAETVTVNFDLSNIGTANTNNLVATLQATGGVTSPSGPQNYGTLVANGPAVTRPFTFTAGTTCGQTITATFQLQDGVTNLGNATFTFLTGGLGAPVTVTYTTGNITTPIPDVSTVDIPITISDTGVITDVNAKIRANHSFDGDLLIELVGPDGTIVPLAINRGSSGANYGSGAADCSGTKTVFDDAAATAISAGAPPFAGTFKPESPLSAFNGKTITGTWKLRVTDTAADDTGTVFCVQLEITRQRFVCCGVPGTPQIVSGGAATVTAENFSPANNAPDPGETVTATFPLINTGDGNTTNLVATLQNSGGVTPITTSQNYGVVVAGGPAVSQPFTFVASGACGGTITATLHLQDGALDLGNVTYQFTLGTTSNSNLTFSNPGTITIPASGTGATTGAPSTPYPSNITVSGAPATISKVTVTLTNMSHTFPDDVDFLLVSPTGRKMIILSDAGDTNDWVNATITLDDNAALPLNDVANNPSGTYRPGDFGTVQDPFPAPAPAGAYLVPAPGGADTLTSAFTGVAGGNPNGTWSLYIVDDAGTDVGAVTGGWSITLTSSSQVCATNQNLIISEFRERGDPAGAANNEFIEFYNNSNSPITVSTTDASAGWALVSSDGVTRFVIANGTVIPARGHYLATNSVGYQLGGYATGDITYATDIPDNSGLALFNSSTSLILANRLDAAGFTTSPALYREGVGLATFTAFNIDSTEYRDLRTGFPQDTGDNVADFRYVDTNGTLNGGQQRLGAPGPENLASAIHNTTGTLNQNRIDPSVGTNAAPNFVFDPTSIPAQNASFGSILVRRTFTNNTGAPLTGLRFRIVDIATFPSPAGTADLRPRTSAGGVVPIGGSNPACPGGNCPMQVLTLQQPPSQPNGGGFNSSLGANTVTAGTPLANGASINVEFLMGIQQSGCYRFVVIAETLPGGSSLIFGVNGSAGPAGSCAGNPPTAAPGLISGNVSTVTGDPLAGVAVDILGQQSATAITDENGNYSITGVDVGGFYTVTPRLANYHFSPGNRSFSLVGNKTDAGFTAVPNAVISANAIDTSAFFVRQHYLDFLGREPDQAGFNFWNQQLSQCNGDLECIRGRRIDVSASYFMSDEFQESASFVYRLYRGALGRQLSYAEFSADRSRVLGGSNLDASRVSFADAFVQRPEFAERYQSAVTADAFVDALLQTLRDSTGVDLSNERASLITKYGEGQSMNQSRSLALRALVNESAFSTAVYKQSFVLMEYYGYLRRDPDAGGYAFWLNVINNEPNNYRGMVCAFLTSAEYQHRFSPVVTHNNTECGR